VQQQQLRRRQQAAEYAVSTGCSPPVLFAPSPLLPAVAGGQHLLAAAAGPHHRAHAAYHHADVRHAGAALGLNYLRASPTAVKTCPGGGIVAVPALGVGVFDAGAHGHVGVLDHGMFEAPWVGAHEAYDEYYGAGAGEAAGAAAQGGNVEVHDIGVYAGDEYEGHHDHHHHHHHHHGLEKNLVLDEDGGLLRHKGMVAGLGVGHAEGLGGNGDMMDGELMEELAG
jgi:hypothetical protein